LVSPQDKILAAVDAGHLQLRVSSIHGNPWLRLVRREVEDLMNSTYADCQHTQRRKAQLTSLNKELRRRRARIAALDRAEPSSSPPSRRVMIGARRSALGSPNATALRKGLTVGSQSPS